MFICLTLNSLHTEDLFCVYLVSSHRFQPLPGPVDVSGPQRFHQSAHVAPETEEPAHPDPVGKKAARVSPPLARYTSEHIQLEQHDGFIYICDMSTRIKVCMFFCRCGGPMCGLQGHIGPLRRQTWLLEPRAQGPEATHLAGPAGSVVGHHGASTQVPWYRYDHTSLYLHVLTWRTVMKPLKVFFLFAVAVRGSRAEAYLSDVEGNGSQSSESLSRDTWVTPIIWLHGGIPIMFLLLKFLFLFRLCFYFLTFD